MAASLNLDLPISSSSASGDVEESNAIGGRGRDYKDYYDIMFLGKTGMGKSTTVDKILMANPNQANYDYNPSTAHPTITYDTLPTEILNSGNGQAEALGPNGDDITNGGELQGSVSTIKTATQCSDLSMWHLSENQDQNEVERRLKNLVMWRSLDSPHEHVNKSRTHSSSSVSCELFSNDTSKIRVLDVPGFYGPNVVGIEERRSSDVFDLVGRGIENDLTIMRKILHIKVATQFKFNRIVYFLPDTGVLTRPSQILQTEIGIMEHYFKLSVFNCMVVVATHNHSIYSKVRKDCDLYTAEELGQTRAVFRQAMRKVFISDDIPDPPIIFISQFDTCDEILWKIKESKVVKEGVGLIFNPSTCAKCGIHIGMLADPDKPRSSEVGAVAICMNKPGSVAIPYDESLCHPRLVPKYNKVQCLFGGMAHLLLWKQFLGRWPYFGNQDEVCLCCNKPPKATGCTRVGTKYKHKKVKGDGIEVKHTPEVEENYQFVVDTTDSITRMSYSGFGESEEERPTEEQLKNDSLV